VGTTRRSRLRKIGAISLVSGCITMGVSLTTATQAGADVLQTNSAAFGISAELLGLQLIPATPVVQGASPPFTYSDSDTTLEVGLPLPSCPVVPGAIPLTNILDVCAINVTASGFDNADPHLRQAFASATTAGLAVGTGPNGLLTISAIEIACLADGDTATAEMSIAGGTLGPNPLLGGPVAPNTNITVPGLLSVILNEQIPPTDPNTPGINAIQANAVHIVLLDSTEVILGHVECSATGPDVNQTTVTGPPVTPTVTTPPTTQTTVTTVPPPPPTTAPPSGGPNNNNNTNDNDNNSTNDNTNTNTQNQNNTQTQTGGSNTNVNTNNITILGSSFDDFRHRGHFSNEPPAGKALARTGAESSRLTGVAFLLLLLGGVLVLATRQVTADGPAIPGVRRRRSLRSRFSSSRRWR
jgi:hypothetical protein